MPHEITVRQEAVPQASTPERVINAILDMARDQSIDINKLERLMTMQQQMVADQRHLDFDSAMTRLQAKIPQIEKYGQGKNSKFVKYEDLDAILKPLLADEGFSVAFSEDEQKDGKVRFALEVSRAGHSKFYYRTVTTDVAAMNRDGRSIRPAIQDDGSTTSYARRYLTKMAFNIVEKNEDTDGEKNEPINADEVKVVRDLIKETKSDEAGFLKFAGVLRIEDIAVRNYRAMLNALETKKRAMPKDSGSAVKAMGDATSPAAPSGVATEAPRPDVPITQIKPGVYEPENQVPNKVDAKGRPSIDSTGIPAATANMTLVQMHQAINRCKALRSLERLGQDIASGKWTTEERDDLREVYRAKKIDLAKSQESAASASADGEVGKGPSPPAADVETVI